MTDDAISADDLVARAIRQIIHSVPGDVEEAPTVEAATSQPWAETASPSAKNKRPLEALLSEYAARVAAAPGALAPLPQEPHPSVSFFDRFGQSPGGADGQRRRRRRRFGSGRRGRGGSGGGGENAGGGSGGRGGGGGGRGRPR